jgi:hypothetical protein
VLVLDESGSVGEADFDLARKATAKMIGDLMSAGPDIRVGLVEFGTVARSPQPLTSNLKAAIKSTLEMPYAAGATNTTGGYNMARDMLIAGNKGPDY